MFAEGAANSVGRIPGAYVGYLANNSVQRDPRSPFSLGPLHGAASDGDTVTDDAVLAHESMDLAQHPQSASRARRFVEHMCAGAMSVDMCDTTVLLVSELVTNAVTHANAPHLSILLSPSGVRVEVGDASQDLPIPRAPDVWREGGRGIALLDMLATAWGVRQQPGGKGIWFEVDGPCGLVADQPTVA